jgi:Ser/Thr protein kinase RdoA (MazF antagonist)
MGLDDRYWAPISAREARDVLGAGAEVLARHRRWLFATARCRTPDGRELYLKRQPPMGRDREQLEWQHALTNHLADRAVPAARAVGLAERGGLWYELIEPAAGEDVYAGADSWDPFGSEAHVRAAGETLARLHAAGAGFRPLRPQPQAGFVVQVGAVRDDPVTALRRLADARPAVAEYLAGEAWEADVEEAYGERFDRLRPVVERLPVRPLHGDWQTNNLFFEGDRVSGIIDFHQADAGPRALDLAVAVERNAFFWNRISAGDDAALDLDAAGLLIAAYDAATPLEPAERAAFADLLAVCQFEYGISFLDYYWGVERDREKADWAWHTFVLGHARWWRSPAGRAAFEAISARAERAAAAP